jgi:NAD(P)-dependent dehydrogenase (short-subunit alcohol dehydrogenase family)
LNQNPFSLAGKVIIITGGYGYLGKSITNGLLENEAQVVVLGRNQGKFAAAFPQNMPNLEFVTGDVSNSESVKEAFANVADAYGRIDGLINNAFYSQGQKPLGLTDEEFAFGLDGNLGSVYRCIREVAPYMQKQKQGRIINVSSMYGMVSPDFGVYQNHEQHLNPPHYGAAKAGVLQLTRYFATYLGKDNILVNSVTPGPFPNLAVQQNQGFIHNLEKKSPLGRIGQPDELKGIFVLLCSDLASYMTGQNFVVDGGWTAW